MAILKENSKIGGALIYSEANIKSAPEIVMLSQVSYPKTFSKGIACHGYGDTNNGMGNMDKLEISTETISKIGWGTSSRNYCGFAMKNDFTYGYAYGGYGNTSPDSDDAPAMTKENMSKTDMANETQEEVVFDCGTSAEQSNGLFNNSGHSYVFREGNSIKKHTHSDDSQSVTDLWDLNYQTTNLAFSNYYGAGYIVGGYDSNLHFYKMNFDSSTYSVLAGTSLSKQYDGAANGYGSKVVTQIKGNASKDLGFFHFTTEMQTIAGKSAIKKSGEVQPAGGNGYDYNIGGYESGGSGQNPYSEKCDQTTAVCSMLPDSSYSMSSAAQYIV